MYHFALFLLFIVKVNLSDDLWAEMGQQHHALPLQRAVLAVQLQGGETERYRRGNTNVSVKNTMRMDQWHCKKNCLKV